MEVESESVPSQNPSAASRRLLPGRSSAPPVQGSSQRLCLATDRFQFQCKDWWVAVCVAAILFILRPRRKRLRDHSLRRRSGIWYGSGHHSFRVWQVFDGGTRLLVAALQSGGRVLLRWIALRCLMPKLLVWSTMVVWMHVAPELLGFWVDLLVALAWLFGVAFLAARNRWFGCLEVVGMVAVLGTDDDCIRRRPTVATGLWDAAGPNSAHMLGLTSPMSWIWDPGDIVVEFLLNFQEACPKEKGKRKLCFLLL